MTLKEAYGYLVRARRDVWAVLEAAPAEALSRDVIGGPRFHCVKDLLFHVIDAEDGWTNGDLRRQPMIQASIPELWTAGPDFSSVPLAMLRDYGRRVEESTAAYLAELSPAEEREEVTVEDGRFRRGDLLWHVLTHEMRHAAQIALLLRMQGVAPPKLDLLFYLPLASA